MFKEWIAYDLAYPTRLHRKIILCYYEGGFFFQVLTDEHKSEPEGSIRSHYLRSTIP